MRLLIHNTFLNNIRTRICDSRQNLSTAIARRERDTQMRNQTALFCFRRLPETSPLWLTFETLHGDLAMRIMLTRLLIMLYINRLKNRRHPALEGYIMHYPPPVRHLRATTTGLSDYEDSRTHLLPVGSVGITVSDI